MYSVMKMWNDGIEREKTLFYLANEIRCTNPKMIVKIISKRKGRVYFGKAADITFVLGNYYLNRCVQEIQEDECGMTIILR